MGMARARNRLVNFRLTQDELENLKAACLVKGARNLSDFARSAVLESVDSEIEPDGVIRNRLSMMDVKLAGMENNLQHMNELLRGVLKGLVQTAAKEKIPCAQ